MAQVMTKISANFLGAGPSFELLVPEGLFEIPQSETVLDFGMGGRSFVYAPKRIERPPEPEFFTPVSAVRGFDGETVDVFEANGLPKLWVVRFPIETGAIYTHVRDLEGFDTVAVVAENIEISLESPLPTVIGHGPITSGISDFPGYQEMLSFFSHEMLDRTASQDAVGAGYTPSMVLTRPGTLPRGATREETSSDGLGRAIVGAALATDVTVAGPRPTDELLESAAAVAEEMSNSLGGV